MRHDHARRQSCNTAITGFARAAEPGAGHRSLHVDCPILAAPRLTVRNVGHCCRLHLQHLELAECPVSGGDHVQAPRAGPGCCGFALRPDRTCSLPQGAAMSVSF